MHQDASRIGLDELPDAFGNLLLQIGHLLILLSLASCGFHGNFCHALVRSSGATDRRQDGESEGNNTRNGKARRQETLASCRRT